MSRLYLLFCTTLLISAVLSVPITPQKRSFKIHRVRQANYVPNGPKALRKAFSKFGYGDISFVVPSLSAVDKADATAGSDEEGDVSASPTQNDAEFLSPVSVGGQTLVMDFDTGSSDM